MFLIPLFEGTTEMTLRLRCLEVTHELQENSIKSEKNKNMPPPKKRCCKIDMSPILIELLTCECEEEKLFPSARQHANGVRGKSIWVHVKDSCGLENLWCKFLNLSLCPQTMNFSVLFPWHPLSETSTRRWASAPLTPLKGD